MSYLAGVNTVTGSGLSFLNGLNASSQTFNTGTTGSTFNIVSSGSAHTFNIPDGSLTARGFINTIFQSFLGDKTFRGIILDAFDVTNLVSGGSVGTAATTVDLFSTLRLAQVTNSQALTIPTPTNTDKGRLLFVTHNGTATGTTVNGVTISVGKTIFFMWGGSSWNDLAGGSGSGSSTFTALTDVPNSYTGQSLKAVRVNTTATGLEFYTPTGGGITNLDYIPSPTNGVVTSDTGTDATIPIANGTNAGLTLNDYSTAEKNKLGFVTVTQAVNLDTIESNSDASKVKTDFITITQPVNLDTLESDTVTNNAKVSNATHTGDATGSTALTLATVNANVGSFGLAGSIAQFVVNAKGLITSAVNVAISITASQVSDFASAVNALITGKQNTVSLTTTGTSGPSTFNSSTGALNIPNYAGGGGSGNNAETFKDQNPKLDSTYGLVAGLINGTNTLFTVSQGSYLPGKLTVYFQGQAQAQASTRDFVETNPATGTFTFNIAPPTGSIIMAEYSTTGPAGTMIIQDEGVTQSAVATTINFTGPGVTATAVGPVVTVNVTGGGASTLTWDFLVDNWSVKPTKTLIPTGRVFTHTLLGTTRYRFVPTIYNPTQDAFYANFDGTTLTNLIITRG